MRGLKLKINFSFMDVAVWFYIVTLLLANGSVLWYISVALLLGCGAVFQRKRVPLNGYLLLMTLFILYNGLLFAIGTVEYPEVSFSRWLVVILNHIICIVLFAYFINEKQCEKFEKWFVAWAFILLLYVVFFSEDFLFDGRFGDTAPYLSSLIGLGGGYMNSNSVGRIFCIAIFMLFNYSICRGTAKLTKKDLLKLVLFLIAVVLTGSRGALIMTVGYIGLFAFLSSKNVNKKVQYILVGIVLLGMGLFLVFKVPVLYQIIGQRIEVLFTDAISSRQMGGGDGDSMYHRVLMIQQGMDVFSERPLFGWGLFAYSQMDTVGTYTHNNFVELLVSCGVIGFSIYYSAFVWLGAQCIKNGKRRERKKEAMSHMAFLIVAFAMNMVTVEYVDRIALLQYTYMAACGVHWRRKRRNEKLDMAEN